MAPTLPLEYVLGKNAIKAELLSVEDLMSLSRYINSPEVMDLSAIEKFASNPKGCEVILQLAMKKVDPTITIEQITKMGSILRRTQIAKDIFIKSVISGEEDESNSQ